MSPQHDSKSDPEKPESPITGYRREHNLTLEAFGALFEPAVHNSSVLRWERGDVSGERALLIEKVTGIRREDLCPLLFAGMERAA